MNTFHIDLCTYDDYDGTIRSLLENNIKIIGRSKMKMVVAVETTLSLEDLKKRIILPSTKETFSVGQTPLDPLDLGI